MSLKLSELRDVFSCANDNEEQILALSREVFKENQKRRKNEDPWVDPYTSLAFEGQTLITTDADGNMLVQDEWRYFPHIVEAPEWGRYLINAGFTLQERDTIISCLQNLDPICDFSEACRRAEKLVDEWTSDLEVNDRVLTERLIDVLPEALSKEVILFVEDLDEGSANLDAEFENLIGRSPDLEFGPVKQPDDGCYAVRFSREVSESVTLRVHATSPGEAEEAALAELSRGAVAWELDQDSCGREPAYIDSVTPLTEREPDLDPVVSAKRMSGMSF